ncbi:MAG: alpha/beta hydrolase [Rhodospirillaceae bacterium]|nr:alpha/beta hydrolase [Rhodospirillaceae bacterium]
MAQVRKAYVDTAAGQLHYYAAPGAGAPVVFLHQTASSGKMYLDVMARLAGRSMYAMDTPGFGGSFEPPDMPSMPQYAAWIVQALDGIGLGAVHLFGHHTGACIAAEICAAHPARVKSCAMIGPVPLTKAERDAFRTHYSTPFSPDPAGTYLRTTWDYLRGLGAHSTVALHHREFVDTCRAYMGRYKAYSAVWDQDFTALFAKISCPLLLMCAPDDVLIAYLERARGLRPDARVRMLKGANFEPDQDPDGTAAALREFLAEVEK